MNDVILAANQAMSLLVALQSNPLALFTLLALAGFGVAAFALYLALVVIRRRP